MTDELRIIKFKSDVFNCLRVLNLNYWQHFVLLLIKIINLILLKLLIYKSLINKNNFII